MGFSLGTEQLGRGREVFSGGGHVGFEVRVSGGGGGNGSSVMEHSEVEGSTHVSVTVSWLHR